MTQSIVTHRPGMTTLEVLCATVLATLLMTAVLGVVSGVAKREKTLARHQVQPAWVAQLRRQLEGDLQTGHTIRFTERGFILTGPLGRERASGVSTWQPLEVEYQLIDLRAEEFSTALVRRSRPPGSASTKPETVLLSVGASRLAITSVPVEAYDAEVVAEEKSTFLTDLTAGEVPGRLSVTLWQPDRAEPAATLHFLRP